MSLVQIHAGRNKSHALLRLSEPADQACACVVLSAVLENIPLSGVSHKYYIFCCSYLPLLWINWMESILNIHTKRFACSDGVHAVCKPGHGGVDCAPCKEWTFSPGVSLEDCRPCPIPGLALFSCVKSFFCDPVEGFGFTYKSDGEDCGAGKGVCRNRTCGKSSWLIV